MTSEDRLEAFKKLGKYLGAIDEVTLDTLVDQARRENSWFTQQSVITAIDGIKTLLNSVNLDNWLSAYNLNNSSPKTVALVMAGNIPLVGFHDVLCVLISGHKVMMKMSSKDTVLMNFLVAKLCEIEPRFGDRIATVDLLKNYDAVIATGSDNSARYFEYYFRNKPHIIRKNRSSCAVLTGFESDEEIRQLGRDVFTYFGLGCRNVSKLYVPAGYTFDRLIETWSDFSDIMNHHKYHNNYDYQKSILLVNKVPFLDAGFLLLQESTQLVSPISVLFYEFYESWDSVVDTISRQREKIQCVVGNVEIADVKMGSAQNPGPSDYADGIDTLTFLTSLN